MAARKFLSNIDLSNNQLLNFSLQNLATHPSTSGKLPGWTYWNTTNSTAYIFTGVTDTWLDLGQIYTHPTVGAVNPTLSGAKVLATLVTNAEGHITSVTTRDLTLSDLGYSGAANANYYVHPTFAGNDLGAALTGAVVISDINVNAEGHVTGFATRSITASDLGAATTSHTHSLSQVTDVTATASEVNLLDLSGLTAGWVLRATGAASAVWMQLQASDLNNDMGWITLNDAATNTTQTWSSSKIQSELNSINSSITGGLINKGGYDVATNTPNLDSTPIAGIKNGWTYVATTTGSFFTETLQVGDMLIAKQDSPTTLAHWTIVQKNVDQASSSVLGLVLLASAAEVQAGTDTTKAITASTLSSRTATETRTGLAEIATQAETDAGTDDTRIVTPLKLATTLNSRVGGISTTLGDGVATTISFANSLGTADVTVRIYEVSTGDTIETEVAVTVTTVTVKFNTAPTTGQYRIVIKK